MIVFFGPAGAGKSVQGQMLASRHGWDWLSTGQLLRDSKDEELLARIESGQLVSDEIANRIVVQALASESAAAGVVLDGYPRNLDQAKYLLEASQAIGQTIELAIVLDVSKEEVITRLSLRGRADDTPEAISKRHAIYHEAIDPILTYFTEQGVPVAWVSGLGDVDTIHERVEAELAARGIAQGQ